MDNPKAGGNGGRDAGEPMVFDAPVDSVLEGQGENLGGNEKDEVSKPVNDDKAVRAELGSVASKSEDWGKIATGNNRWGIESTGGNNGLAHGVELAEETAVSEIDGKAAELKDIKEWELGEKEELTGKEIVDFPEVTAQKSLATDGTTEGKIDKQKIWTFDGEIIDKESVKYIEEKVEEYKNDPFELDNIKNKMMTEGLRDNYGRIFGDDGADGVGRQGADESGKTMEFSELRNMEMAQQMAKDIPGMSEIVEDIKQINTGGENAA